MCWVSISRLGKYAVVWESAGDFGGIENVLAPCFPFLSSSRWFRFSSGWVFIHSAVAALPPCWPQAGPRVSERGTSPSSECYEIACGRGIHSDPKTKQVLWSSFFGMNGGVRMLTRHRNTRPLLTLGVFSRWSSRIWLASPPLLASRAQDNHCLFFPFLPWEGTERAFLQISVRFLLAEVLSKLLFETVAAPESAAVAEDSLRAAPLG